jgi:hypothetical protein
VELTYATTVPIDQSPDVAGAFPHVAHKHVVAHWMVELNADVGGSMLETERGQHPDAALVPRLDHRTNLVAVEPIPCRMQNNSSERATEPSPHPFRVHPPAKIEHPFGVFESRDAGFRTDTEESDQLAARCSPYRRESVDALGNLTVEVVHRPRSVVSPVGDYLGILRCHRTHFEACGPPSCHAVECRRRYAGMPAHPIKSCRARARRGDCGTKSSTRLWEREWALVAVIGLARLG